MNQAAISVKDLSLTLGGHQVLDNISFTINQGDLTYILGANGSGKSTTAPKLLRDTLQVDVFINADVIAGGLSAFAPERVAFPAGRIMLRRMHELATAGADFALESTLSSHSQSA